MGHWGYDIYDGDATLDYLATITNLLKRELAYCLSPEPGTVRSGWLAQMLTLIELTLLFEQRDSGSVDIRYQVAVYHWRDVFFGVWDGEWQDAGTPGAHDLYGKPEYRKENRPAVAAMFDRLVSIAHYWENFSNNRAPKDFPPLLHPLPYFSIKRWTTNDNQPVVNVERFISGLIEHLLKDIIYYLSPEKRAESNTSNVGEVWVAVDILGFLCATYEQPAGMNPPVIRAWRETTTQIWKQFLGGDESEWDGTDPLYLNIMAAFDRLEDVAQKYPSMDYDSLW